METFEMRTKTFRSALCCEPFLIPKIMHIVRHGNLKLVLTLSLPAAPTLPAVCLAPPE
jgi:hypothetical protein